MGIQRMDARVECHAESFGIEQTERDEIIQLVRFAVILDTTAANRSNVKPKHLIPHEDFGKYENTPRSCVVGTRAY